MTHIFYALFAAWVAVSIALTATLLALSKKKTPSVIVRYQHDEFQEMLAVLSTPCPSKLSDLQLSASFVDAHMAQCRLCSDPTTPELCAQGDSLCKMFLDCLNEAVVPQVPAGQERRRMVWSN